MNVTITCKQFHKNEDGTFNKDLIETLTFLTNKECAEHYGLQSAQVSHVTQGKRSIPVRWTNTLGLISIVSSNFYQADLDCLSDSLVQESEPYRVLLFGYTQLKDQFDSNRSQLEELKSKYDRLLNAYKQQSQNLENQSIKVSQLEHRVELLEQSNLNLSIANRDLELNNKYKNWR